MRLMKSFCLFATVFCVQFAAQADTTRSTAGGIVTWTHSNTSISEVSLVRGANSHGDGYDGAMNIQVSGSVQYGVRLHFSSTYAMAIEYVAVTNTTASAKTYSITCSGNLGSDGSTTWHYASAGGPYYTISSDQSSASSNGGDPVVSFLYGDLSVNGLGSQRSMPYSNGSDTHSFTISNVVIPAGAVHGYLFLGGAGDIDDISYNRPDQARLAVLQLVDSRNWPDDFTDFLGNDRLEQIVNWDISVDEMKIAPDAPAVFLGYPGGPFHSTNQVYTAYNRTESALDWAVSSSEDWLLVEPGSGRIGPDEIQEIGLSLGEAAAGFPVGDHVATLTFTNHTLRTTYIRQAVVSVHPLPAAPAAPLHPSPANGATNVSAGSLLEWEHDSGTASPSPLVNTTATYTVYFGTNANALVPAASGLSTSYDPGILEVDTTYYWQVVASNAVGSTTGAVWSFSTWISGPLDHFDVEIVSEHPRMRHPIDVAVYAKDLHGHTVIDYTASAMLAAFRNTTNATTLLSETFEGADVDDWNLGLGVHTTNDHSFAGNECLFFPTNSSTATFTHAAVRPGEIRVAVCSDNVTAESYIIFGGASGYAGYVYMSGDSMLFLSGDIFQSVPIEAGRWYSVAIRIDWEERRLAWFLDGELVASGLGFLDGEIDSLDRISIVSSSGNQVRYDEIQYLDTEIVPQAVPITPATTAEFIAGVWSGQVEVDEYIASAFLTASDGFGHSGRSEDFEVDYLGDLGTWFPDDLTEGDGLRPGAGQVFVTVPPPSNLVVWLELAPGAEIEIPETVVIPAGQTNAAFDVTVLDDGLLDGSQTAFVRVALADYRGGTTAVPIHDDETAELSIALPGTISEGIGYVSGVLEVDRAPDVDVWVELLSDNPESVPSGSVIIPAGETYVPFNLRVRDNSETDGVRTATITAHVRNWTGSQASMFILDNDTARLVVNIVPAQIVEGAGVQSGKAYVSLSGSATHDVNVLLRSSDPSQLSVPEWVTVRAGLWSASFDFEVHDDAEADGAQTVSVVAQAPGYVSGADTIKVIDNELHHLAIAGLASNVSLLQPVAITVSARTIDGYLTDAFDGTVVLSAVGDRGAIDIAPSVITNLVNGIGSETVVFGNIGNDVVLVMDGSGGVQGTSSVFHVVAPQIAVAAEPLTNVLVVAGTSSTSTITISNTGNAELEFMLVDPTLAAYYPFDGDAADASGNGRDGIAYGTQLAADRFGTPNSAYRFNGSDSYVDAGSMGGFKTVTMWIRPDGRYKIDYYFGHPDFRLYAAIGTGGTLTLSDGEGTIATSAKMDNYVNQWVHVAAISDGENSRVYLNGNLVGTGTLGAVSNAVVNLGRDPGNYHYFNGRLDEVRVYDRVLSVEEIRQLHEESRLEEGLAASYPFDGTANDVSGNDRNGVAFSASPTADRFGHATSAYWLNGSYSYLQFPSGIVAEMTECSLSLWVNLSRLDTWSRIFDFGTGEQVYMFLTPRSGDSTLRFVMSINGYGAEQRIDTSMRAANQWHHIVVVLGGGTGTLYVNGAVAGQNTSMTLTPAALGTTTRNWIGRSQFGPDPYLSGAVDDFRIYNRTLAGSEIDALYREGAAEPEREWLTVAPASGIVPPGGSTHVAALFDATDRIAGDHDNKTLRIACNDVLTPKVELPVSMWVLPTAPAMAAEPEYTEGTSNAVSWSAVEGPVNYEVVVATHMDAAPLESVPALAGTNHTFSGLAANTQYYYRARATVAGGTGRLAGPWSGWVGSIQVASLDDLDGDSLPDWWEEMYLGGMALADPQGDADGDGQSNYDEYMAGTNPTNAADCFMLQPSVPSSNGVFVVQWNSVTGRMYSVYWSPTLGSAFQALETNMVYPRNSYTDQVHQAEMQGYYRVEVEMERE